MKTGMLLEELINIAQVPKTDFALSMNMTPSGLSKILAGRRLPFFKEKTLFSRQAANYFSEAIYGYNCYTKFEKIFPVIYDFSSKYELELFLTNAIEYTLSKDFSEENNENLDYPDRGTSYLGTKTILNMLCIFVSDYLINCGDLPLELYSTLPLFDKHYSDVFRRVKIISCDRRSNLFFHHFFNMAEAESHYDRYQMGILSGIAAMQQYGDLNLWTTQEKTEHYFLLIKGRFLMLFNSQIEGTLLMTVITHKSYLAAFFSALMRKDVKKISFTKDEAIAGIETDLPYVDHLIDGGIEAVYNFISIGHLVKKEDLDKLDGSEAVKAWMLRAFQSILTQKTLFYVTLDAMMGFHATGKAIVPLVGAVDIPPKERVDYLLRYNSYLEKDQPEKVILLNCEMPKVAVIHFPEFSVIYLINNEHSSEKIHIFETNMIHSILAREISSGSLKTMPFSHDLWDSYISGLSGK